MDLNVLRDAKRAWACCPALQKGKSPLPRLCPESLMPIPGQGAASSRNRPQINSSEKLTGDNPDPSRSGLLHIPQNLQLIPEKTAGDSYTQWAVTKLQCVHLSLGKVFKEVFFSSLEIYDGQPFKIFPNNHSKSSQTTLTQDLRTLHKPVIQN